MSSAVMADDLDLWGESNHLVEEVYKRDNIRVIDYNNSDKCYVFFASNHLFYPNTRENFVNTMLKGDRFEWVRISKKTQIVKSAGRVIILRDVYKQWYTTGINNTINTIDKLVDKLRDLTEGYRVVTVGISAGGYIAALVAAKLNAEMCFDISGQIMLDRVNKNFFYKRYGYDIVESPYYDISDIIGDSNCLFFYFYPFYFQSDKEIYERLSGFKNVYGFGFNQRYHAANMMASNYPFIISKESSFILKLYKKYENRVINNFEFFFRTVPFIYWIPLGLRETKQYINRMVRRMQGKFV